MGRATRALVAALVLTGTAAGQAKLPTVGVLLFATPEAFQNDFREGLRELGYVEGQNVAVEYRWAGGQAERLAALAADLVSRGVDVVVATPTPAVEAARRATSTIPIVMAPAGNPVATGLVTSLARPGANVTGVSSHSAELGGKRLGLIREVLPRVTRIGALVHATDPFAGPFLKELETSAAGAGMQILPIVVRGPDEVDRAFAVVTRERPGALVLQPILATRRAAELAAKHRVPAISEARAFADSGGLMSYGASLAESRRRAAVYVDRILKGVRPADLPIAQPTRFELVVNLATARALGLTIPQPVVLRADHVIYP
ncbi:MAG TPA: ABC transporter substrate-binding protein [Methylomirabilota bacterium]|nr:ABC transporter substrate-binding protein [Methylomirabilota bacterium]